MAENDNTAFLASAMNQIMSNPELMEIIKSLKDKNGKSDAGHPAESESPGHGSAPSSEGFSLPPEMMAKLPQVLSALSGLGTKSSAFGESSTDSDSQPGHEATHKVGDKQRKALLSSLRPYLNDHRKSIIDSILRIEGLGKLIDSTGLLHGNQSKEGR